MSDGYLEGNASYRNPGINRGFAAIGIAWGALFILCVILAIIFAAIFGMILFGFITIAIAYQTTMLLLAKGEVLKKNEVDVLAGLGRMISWNPSEGVLFLKNKIIDFVDDNPNDGGGIRIIFPLMGEELAARVPLEIQTMPFEDSNILTREFIPLSIKATIFWRINNISSFYLSLGKEIHSLDDHGGHAVSAPSARRAQMETAERWLSSMMEEQTRAIVSKVGTGLLVSDQLIDELPAALPDGTGALAITGPESSGKYRSATDSLAETVKSNVGSAVSHYGIEVHRVTLQQINMPPEIYAAAVDACRSAYIPLKAKAESIARRLILEAEAGVLGPEAVGLKEIAANAPALAIQDLLGPLFQKFSRSMRS